MNERTAIYDSASGFARALENIAGTFRADVEMAIRKAVLDLLRDIVKATPFDTCRAKSSWFPSLDPDDGWSRPEGYEATSPQSLRDAMDKAKGVGMLLGDVIYLINNVEYIEALEYGHSEQAPEGMVRMNLDKFARHLEEQARQYWWAS